jgi:hypothetical protein
LGWRADTNNRYALYQLIYYRRKSDISSSKS